MPRHGPFGGHTRQGLCNRVPLPAPTWPLPRHIYILSSVNKKEVRVTEACLHLGRGEPAWVAEKKAERKSAADLCPRAAAQRTGPRALPRSAFQSQRLPGHMSPLASQTGSGKARESLEEIRGSFTSPNLLNREEIGRLQQSPLPVFHCPSPSPGLFSPAREDRTAPSPAVSREGSRAASLVSFLWSLVTSSASP